MKKFKEGDKVEVIEINENDDKARPYLHRLGSVQGPKGFDYEDDDVMVWFGRGDSAMFKEHQLEKLQQW